MRHGQQYRAIIAADKDARRAAGRERNQHGQPAPEYTPSYLLDRQIAKARQDMGERRWNELNVEWEQGND